GCVLSASVCQGSCSAQIPTSQAITPVPALAAGVCQSLMRSALKNRGTQVAVTQVNVKKKRTSQLLLQSASESIRRMWLRAMHIELDLHPYSTATHWYFTPANPGGFPPSLGFPLSSASHRPVPVFVLPIIVYGNGYEDSRALIDVVQGLPKELLEAAASISPATTAT
ncbi:hypothetical protein Vafri_17797, partial [Volvox africanus]